MTIRLYMSMSLDGYIAGPDDRPGQELGRDGGGCSTGSTTGRPGQRAGVRRGAGDRRSDLRPSDVRARRALERRPPRRRADHVLTHSVDDGDEPPGPRRFFTDVVACAAEARARPGDRAVMVHGAGAAQALLRAGQLDELEIHLVPVLLGAGRRLFGQLRPGHRTRARPAARGPRRHAPALPGGRSAVATKRREDALALRALPTR